MFVAFHTDSCVKIRILQKIPTNFSKKVKFLTIYLVSQNNKYPGLKSKKNTTNPINLGGYL